MKVTGIICEYNPLHLGHTKQLQIVRSSLSADDGIVCLMSGNYVQRGAPAIVDKMIRAKAAVLCGADLVLELPTTVSLSSAEGFAAGGVRILSGFCDNLCFGAESADRHTILRTAHALLDPSFPEHLHMQLDKGLSFPVARQAALNNMGLDADVLSSPNNILAVEYCKAILSQNSTMDIFPIHRGGNYHDSNADAINPSATAVRSLMCSNGSWHDLIPEKALHLFENADIHTLAAGERAILARVRCMTDSDFEALPYGSEGLWRKLMHAVRSKATLEDIIAEVKSKRYTRSRIDRMIMCAYLGITKKQLEENAPYVRVLALNDKGRSLLNNARKNGEFINIGQAVEHPYQSLENRCSSLYGMFSTKQPDLPDAQSNYRVYYHK